MKVLFLDIDGVLNSHQSIRMFFRQAGMPSSGAAIHFCPISSSNLQEIMARIPDLKIVVSSTWRIGNTLETMREELRSSGIDLNRVIGMTPVFRNLSRERGLEIQKWLDDHPEVSEFVIVDDDSDMLHLMPKLVQTDTRLGLMWDKAADILTRFGVKEEDQYL
jgi:16S rRNA C1402 (ribose-2'-O) methylase RsmI